MTITDLTIYPVKSLGGVPVESAEVAARGLEHDRRWMVVRPGGEFVTQRQIPALAGIGASLVGDEVELGHERTGSTRIPLRPSAGLPRRSVTVWRDEVQAVTADIRASAWLSEALGEEVELVWMPDDARRAPDPEHSRDEDRVSFADGFPLLLTTWGSLSELNGNLDPPVPMSRFRPNVVVRTSSPWVEESWRSVELGPVDFDAAKPCARCVVTTVPQRLDDLPKPPDSTEPLRTLARIHAVNGKAVFGVNLIPRGAGPIRVGDRVHVRTSVMGA